MKGGRPPMAPNRLSRKRAMQLCADKESPLDIMFDNMLFWHRQSKDLGVHLAHCSQSAHSWKLMRDELARLFRR
jgi:hypothetical protein